MLRRLISEHSRAVVAFVAIVPLLLGVTAWHYWTLYSSLAGARDDLLSAQARLSDVGLDLTPSDIAVARERLDAADGKIDAARTHLKYDPILRLFGLLPGTGPQLGAADDFLAMASLLVKIGDDATGAGSKALTLREQPPEGKPLTQSLMDLLADVQPETDRIATNTSELVERRRAVGDDRLIGPLASARDRLDRELPRLANAVEQLHQAQALLRGFLGFDGERRYLVLPLNNGELLPGGGLVTAAGILPVRDGVNGAIDFTDSTEWKTTWERAGGKYIEPPAPLKRHLLEDFTWNLLVSNWSPDFPTWSQQALDFYRLVHGEQAVDGVVAVDLVVLQQLLKVTGPKSLDVQGFGRVTFDANNAVLELERLTRQPFEPTDDRKSVIGELAQEVMSDLLKLPSDRWSEAVKTVRELGEQRHIQVLSFRPEEQTLIRDFRWDGRIETPAGDYLMFNEASVNSTKLNLIMQPTARYKVDLSPLGDARHALTVHYRNSLPEWSVGKDPKLVQQLMLGGRYGGYLRIFVPAGATAIEALLEGQPATSLPIEDVGSEEGKAWVGVFVPVDPGRQADVTFRWTVPFATSSHGASHYDLYLQKQPGTTGMCMTIEVTRSSAQPGKATFAGGSTDSQGRRCLTSDVRVAVDF